MEKYILAIDQGTTSSRAILFDKQGNVHGIAQEEFPQYYPSDGWVEHNAEEIWQSVENVCRHVLVSTATQPSQIAAIGVTNQRETTVVWDRKTGKPIHRAIVWQDRRTVEFCRKIKKDGFEATIRRKTGLLADPYFSATKIKWILDVTPDARQAAENGDLAFGTVDTWLLWNLTEGRSFLTDATNASRTLLFNIHDQKWDEELLAIFEVPRAILPEVRDSSDEFGVCTLFGGEMPILGMAGDQQAATVGQACFKPGMVKSTYGTGCFVVQNTGEEPLESKNRLLTTVAYRLNGKPIYGLEGSIFIAGAAVQWLRDKLGLISSASETEAIAAELDDTHGVYMVPAFTGLGAPYWDPEARAAIVGLTQDANSAHIIRAALEAVCYQTRDLMAAMAGDGSVAATLRVDGGMVANNWLCGFLADTLNLPVQRPAVAETTALGAAYLAALKLGWYTSTDDIEALWRCETSFEPKMKSEKRERLYGGWLKAVGRVR